MERSRLFPCFIFDTSCRQAYWRSVLRVMGEFHFGSFVEIKSNRGMVPICYFINGSSKKQKCL
jgi:hypothetical protein